MHGQRLPFIRQPFADEVDTAFFFSGGGRGEIVAEVVGSLQNGVSLITLIGPPGSGKTMVCRVVEERLPPSMFSVYLESAVESFNDMVEVVGREVVRDGDLLTNGTTEQILQATAAALKEQKRQLLIIFDEAEHIYLATLERVRRMLDRVNDEELLLHIMFSGGPQLAESLEQLGIVAFREVEERNVVLDNLDQTATDAYLRHCLNVATEQLPDPFPPDIVNGIYRATGGNFLHINRLAREYVQTEESDAPFLVMLDSLSNANGSSGKKRPYRSRTAPGWTKVDLDFLTLPTIRPSWFISVGGVILLVLLAVWWLGRPSGDDGSLTETDEIPAIELQPVEPLQETAGRDQAEVGPGVPTHAESVVAVQQPIEPEPEPIETAEAESPPRAPQTSTPIGSDVGGDEPIAALSPERPDAESVAEQPAPPAETMPPVEPTIAEVPPVAESETDTEERQERVAQDDRPETRSEMPTAIAEDTGGQEGSAEQETVIVRPVIAADQEKKSISPSSKEDQAKQEVAAQPPPLLVADKVKKWVELAPEEPKEPAPPSPAETAVTVDTPTEPATSVAVSVERQAEEEAAEPATEPIAELAAEPAPQEPPASIVTVQPEVQPAVPPATPVPPALTAADGDSLYQERLAAGARWLVGGGSGRFTVQVMVLTSDHAEDNLKQMLADRDYRAVADSLYVLRKLGDPPTVTLYFGEYRTLAAAQQARNTLPSFLRRHDPYPIAVNAAVEKATGLP
ncbi:ExeA family protein [Desulfofustis limnaeus]|jgi:type II secretory pathway predicted ATPase ExeA|uniref:SPOR domain-containing protein n=1 Tax=Desulfofustis limnaeus TaxID=2740163 RepID=A0ABN6M5C4_9BACT|nr:AAA family ATPase [Desulfofustis limnaeus]MDX9894462.1 AAA family ATPase [Desulfofustis sp.]BDD88072.1 hypothetical protein DPPLL_24370 [Desulfofustis limnaeus]